MSASKTSIRTQLLDHLKELRLPTVRECYEQQAQRAQQETLSYEHYLLELTRREVEARRQHRVERFLRESRLPLDKSLEAFELKRLPRQVGLAHAQCFKCFLEIQSRRRRHIRLWHRVTSSMRAIPQWPPRTVMMTGQSLHCPAPHTQPGAGIDAL